MISQPAVPHDFNSALVEASEDLSREPWRAAKPPLREACELLAGGSVSALAASLERVEQARRLISRAGPPGARERGAAAEFAATLAQAVALARGAAEFYRECAASAAAGTIAYGPGGAAPPSPPRAHCLTEA